ncbi:hypothetical protein WJX72_005379 [[Myrmecia] bisecta]|uniref:Fatty acid desaturase domain-containing protein n=1 Tax=[Myrmecia] bisecta TaxID=41462 RepID=A0AAW1QFB7_9CHLO
MDLAKAGQRAKTAVDHVAKYRRTTWRSVFVAMLTCMLYLGCVVGFNFCRSPASLLLWTVLRGLVNVRLFVLAHDAMHGALFKTSKANNKTKQAVLRVVRDPFIFFTVIPIVVFMLFYRIPRLRKSRNAGRPTGVAFTNVFKAVELSLGVAVLGWTWLRCELLAAGIGAGIGFMLFHLQHHVNTAYRAPQSTHNRLDAALLGSTYVPIPWCLRWVTLGIEYHHIHHLSTLVPCYQLQACHQEAPEGCWDDVLVVTPLKALRSMFHVMWNAETRRFEAFPATEKLLRRLMPCVS